MWIFHEPKRALEGGFNEVISDKEGFSPIICYFCCDQGLIGRFLPRMLRIHDPMVSKEGNEDTNPPETTLVACKYSYFNMSLFFMMTKHGKGTLKS